MGVDVDACGGVHVLRTGRTVGDASVNTWLLYLTNATGSWTSEKLGIEAGSVSRFSHYIGPRVDPRGALNAFELSIDAGGQQDFIRWWTTASDRRWSGTEALASPIYDLLGEVTLTRSGKPRLAHLNGNGHEIRVLALGETWSDELVAENLSYQGGLAIWPHTVVFVDGADRTHVLHHEEQDYDVPFTGSLREWVRMPEGWRERPEITIDGALAAATSPKGGLHLVYNEMGGGLIYGTRLEGLDSIDQNCDGVDGVDADGDGVASVETGGQDSEDAP